jgi:hypothetical protein
VACGVGGMEHRGRVRLITRDVLNSPERFFKHLFGTVEDGERELR